MRFESENENVIVIGSKTQKHYAIGTPFDHFEIQDGQVTICWSQDIDLNSAPSITKIINYINNRYNVDLSEVIK